MGTIDISVGQLLIGLLLVLIPAAILYHYRTGLVKPLLVSVIRMVIQLFLVGLYLNYLFEWNNMWVNLAWLLIMTLVCGTTLLRRVHLPMKQLLIPIYLSILFSLIIIAVYFLKSVLQIEYLFESRYFIPTCGILLGNILSSNVIGLNALYDGLRNEQQYYHYMLCNGAKIDEAVRPFFRNALIKAANPTIASMAVMGLISLPGTLIGQILGGSSPGVAIRYQIMIMIIIIASSITSLFFGMKWSVHYAVNEFGSINDDFLG